jgi:hypothetical protein
VSFGASDWWVYGPSWSDPHWTVSYDAALYGYGEWIWVSGLGRVWRPYVANDWRPYTHGRWVHSSMGWTWVAYEPWGYFPHHYGHWALTHHGWAWAPGYVYHPARVVWVHWGGYVGWYAAGPPGWSHGHGYRSGYRHGYGHGYDNGFNHGYNRGYDDGWRNAQYATYVPWRDLSSHDLSRRAVAASRVQRSVPRHRMQLSPSAPSAAQVRARGAEMVPEVRLSRRTVRVDDRSVQVARPEGMADSVSRHAGRTVERALSPERSRESVSRQPDRSANERADRTATAWTGRRADSSHRRTEVPDTRSKAPAKPRLESTSATSRSRAPARRTTGGNRRDAAAAPQPRIATKVAPRANQPSRSSGRESHARASTSRTAARPKVTASGRTATRRPSSQTATRQRTSTDRARDKTVRPKARPR